MTYQGRTLIVTGAGSGIGRATAIRLANAGATVHGLDLRGADATAAECDGPGKIVAHELDATDAKAWAELVGKVAAEGAIDGLALVHGVLARTPDSVVEQTEEEWTRLLTTNLTANFLGMQAVLPTMMEQRRGAIVCTTSAAAIAGLVGLAGYAASKGGIISLVKQSAVEYAPYGIRINAVAPGIITTPMHDGVPDAFLDAVRQQTPMQLLGQPDDVARCIAFLASDDSHFVTGQILAVDGGLLAQGVALGGPV